MLEFEILKAGNSEILSLLRGALSVSGPDVGVNQVTMTSFSGYADAKAVVQAYVPRIRSEETDITLKKLKVDNELIRTLRKWLVDSDDPQEQNTLWLIGDKATYISALVFDACSNKGPQSPVLAFSCRQLDEKGADLSAETLLLHLVYTWLNGLLHILIATPNPPKRINQPGFQRLDGTPKTLELAIDLLGNLLDELSVPCVALIDHFKYLDRQVSPEYKSRLTQLTALFGRRPGRSVAQHPGRHRFLVTTQGPTGYLADMSGDRTLGKIKVDDHIGKGQNVAWEQLQAIRASMSGGN
jgi:hypothetical protein